MDILVKKCPNVRKLKIENNNIEKFENEKKLIGLELKKINIKGNPCLKDIKNYRNDLFNIFLSLICIDDCDKEGNDIESTEYGDAINYFEEHEQEKTEEKLEDITDEEEEDEEEEEEDDIESNNNDLNGEEGEEINSNGLESNNNDVDGSEEENNDEDI